MQTYGSMSRTGCALVSKMYASRAVLIISYLTGLQSVPGRRQWVSPRWTYDTSTEISQNFRYKKEDSIQMKCLLYERIVEEA